MANSPDKDDGIDKMETLHVQETDLNTKTLQTVDHVSEKEAKPTRAQYKVKLVGYKSRKRSAQGLDLMQSLESSVVNKSGIDQHSAKEGSRMPRAKPKPGSNLLGLGKRQATEKLSAVENNLVRDIMSSEFDKQMNEIQGNVRKLYSH